METLGSERIPGIHPVIQGVRDSGTKTPVSDSNFCTLLDHQLEPDDQQVFLAFHITLLWDSLPPGRLSPTRGTGM